MNQNYFRWILLICSSLLISSQAYGYVDPGLIASLYQVLYVALFGLAIGVVVKPYRYIKGLIDRIKQKFRHN